MYVCGVHIFVKEKQMTKRSKRKKHNKAHTALTHKLNKSARIAKLRSITVETYLPSPPPFAPFLPSGFHVNAANITSLHILGDVETLIPLFIVCNKKACCKPYFKCEAKRKNGIHTLTHTHAGQPAKYTVYA